jgi:hypothetical protein
MSGEEASALELEMEMRGVVGGIGIGGVRCGGVGGLSLHPSWCTF